MITRDYDEEEKGYDSDEKMEKKEPLVIEGPALPPPPPLFPSETKSSALPAPPAALLSSSSSVHDTNLQAVDMDMDSE